MKSLIRWGLSMTLLHYLIYCLTYSTVKLVWKCYLTHFYSSIMMVWKLYWKGVLHQFMISGKLKICFWAVWVLNKNKRRSVEKKLAQWTKVIIVSTQKGNRAIYQNVECIEPILHGKYNQKCTVGNVCYQIMDQITSYHLHVIQIAPVKWHRF